MSIELIDASRPTPAKAGTPITGFEDEGNDGQFDNEAPAKATGEDAVGGDASSSTSVKSTPVKLHGRRVFDAAQRMPEIVGGIGSYYIHIKYPEEAIQAGIEGRLVLSFIVEVDGHTTEVEVVERLHPACDSAAVRALRRTRFVPGRQNGDTVPVRMRLPVRFELVEPDGDSSPRKSASS
jgi:protein TonB